MQRIIAGKLGGRRLRGLPPGVEVRPTGARVREAIFSRLFDRVVGAFVLDLFTGSGALAFEALSRGAARVIAIDRDPRVIRHLAVQARELGVAGDLEVIGGDTTAVLAGGRGPRAPVDLVFLDPPYAATSLVEAALAGLVAGEWLAAGAEIIVERARIRGEVAPIALPAGFRRELSRSYGQTAVDFLRGPASSR